MLLDGTQLGRYQVVRLIRRGGMSEVYLAEDTRMSRQIAIKTIQNESALYSDDSLKQEASRLFLREMSIVSSLYHPHILQLYDFGEEVVKDIELMYMVMPFHAEGSLMDWLRQRGKGKPLAAEDVVELISQAADALQYAHDRQVVHLDVKPSNFLVRTRKEKPEQPDLFLADFGIAKVTVTSKDSSIMRGTLEYMAPEQWDGHPVAASDQYALAIMAYELLMGSVPFRGNLSQIMFKHFQEIPQPPSKLNAHVPPAVDPVILRALAKKPEERFASVSEFAQALKQALQTSNEIRATLAISEEEARKGTDRTLTLPGGRKVAVTIPVGTRDGQVMWFTSEGKLTYAADQAGILLLTISVKPKEQTVLIDVDNNKKTERAISLAPLDSSVPDKAPVALEPTVLPLSAEMRGSTEIAVHRAERIMRSLIARKQPRKLALTLALMLIATCLVIASFIGYGGYLNNMSRANAIATSTAIAEATATVAAYPSYFPGKGVFMFYDPLNQPYYWSEYTDTTFGGSCKYINGIYDVSETKMHSLYDCLSLNVYSNFAFQVRMSDLQGDCGGIVFRDSDSNAKMYAYEICLDGYYLRSYTSNTHSSILVSGVIHQELNKTNSIAVVAMGTDISLYVNKQQVNYIHDSLYGSGELGLIANNESVVGATEIAYSDAELWAF